MADHLNEAIRYGQLDGCAGPAVCRQLNPPVRELRAQPPVDPRKPVFRDFSLPGLHNFQVAPRPETVCGDVLRPLGETPPDVVRRYNEVRTACVPSPDHDVRMRMTGVVMVDRQPVETRSEIRFHLRHQGPRCLPQVSELSAVFGRYDEEELLPVAFASPSKILTIGKFVLPRIELATRTIALDTIALDVSEMSLQRPRPATPRGARNIRLHDDPPHPVGRQARCPHVESARLELPEISQFPPRAFLRTEARIGRAGP